MKKEEKTR